MDVSFTNVVTIQPVEGGNAAIPIGHEKVMRTPEVTKKELASLPLDRKHLQTMIEDIQNYIDTLDVCIRFSTYGEDDQNVKIIITEKDTGKVIREIPSEKLQYLFVKMSEVVGLIFSDTA
jgi:flagellar protein FlaG